jgi:hypothetical protein
MPFSGGGGGQLTNHVHDNTPLQGGPLNFNNTTIGGMSAGDITYSDGNALQILSAPGVPAGEVLTFPAAATAPSWQVAGAGSQQFQLLGFTELGAPNTVVDVTGLAVKEQLCGYFIGKESGAGSINAAVTLNADTGPATYACRRDFNTGGSSGSTNQNSINDVWNSDPMDVMCMWSLSNTGSGEQAWQSFTTQLNLVGAGNAPNQATNYSKWTNPSNQDITQITFTSTSAYDTGSILAVFGITPV